MKDQLYKGGGEDQRPQEGAAQPSSRPSLVTQVVTSAELHGSTLQQNNFTSANASNNSTGTQIQLHVGQANLAQGAIMQQNIAHYHLRESREINLPEIVEKLKGDAYNEVTSDHSLVQGLDLRVALEGASFAGAKAGVDLENQVTKDFLSASNPAKVFLLQGNSGAGKTLFGRYVEKKLWESYQPGQYIPIFVSLPSLQTKSTHALNRDLLKTIFDQKFLDEELSKQLVRYCKEKRLPIFLILDAYDETGLKDNIYQDNSLNDYNIKVLTTCRSQYLTDDYKWQFAQLDANNVPAHGSLIESYIIWLVGLVSNI